MKKKTLSKKTLLSCIALLPLAVYMVVYLDRRPLSAIRALRGFSIAAENLVLWGSLLLLSSLIFLFSINSEPKETNPGCKNLWVISFLVPYILLIALVVYVNPHGRFPWKLYPFTTTAAHYQKIALYKQLSKPPQVIVLGSSHSYTIQASYISEVLDKDAFNMAVGSAGPMDELILARYITKNTTEIPQLFIVELVATDLGTSAWQNYMPLNLVPYFSFKNKLPIIQSALFDTVSLRSLTDALFLLVNQDAKEYITFLPDGTGQRSKRSASFYQNNIQKQIPAVFGRNTCDVLDHEGQKAINQFVELAEEYKIGVVFYRSPVNAEFFEQANLEKPRYQKCQQLFATYMQNLVQSHPNVFYVDLFDYEPISSLREDGYIDAQHLVPEASNLVIDALLFDLEKALQWSSMNRQKADCDILLK